MNDAATEHRVLKHIEDLVAEEHRLEQGGGAEAERQRLAKVQVELD